MEGLLETGEAVGVPVCVQHVLAHMSWSSKLLSHATGVAMTAQISSLSVFGSHTGVGDVLGDAVGSLVVGASVTLSQHSSESHRAGFSFVAPRNAYRRIA